MDLGIGKESLADAQQSNVFQRTLRPVHETRLRYMTPAERTTVRREGAIIVGLSGLIALVTDLRIGRKHQDHRRMANIHWSARARGWVFR